ncbi:MAG TPA: hypothetical protein VL426_07770 [Candidatus Binatia bacterium]|nr:hypothetical protein [Candidatus Binatia bacterium]
MRPWRQHRTGKTARRAAVIAAALFALPVAAAVMWFAFPYASYRVYMAWLASGVGGGYVRLPASLAAELRPRYADDISTASVAFTTRLPKNLAVSDCKTVYFGNDELVAALREGRSLSAGQLHWLAHELTHGEQCERWGGRKAFAETWFRQADAAAWRTVTAGGLAAGITEYVRTQYVRGLHDSMPMEIEADERAGAVTGTRR